ncbi:MAG: WYL domain-containing protein [Clostridia bacterium]|nr:WYL domain-containing protein [Clostridia bacterium]
MPKSSNQKLKLLYIKDYLERYSDEEHVVTVPELISYLERNGISAERKSIYSDIEYLRDFGMDIVNVKGGQFGYYLASRDFEIPELKLLVDAVAAAKFLTEKKSDAIIKKIASLAGEYGAGELKRVVYVPNRVRTHNERIFYNVDAIHRAISENKMICFRYSEWTLDFGGASRVKRTLRRNGKNYAITPCELVWDDEYYYLIGYDAEEDLIKHFRVDKMEQPQVSELPAQRSDKVAKFDVAAYMGSTFRMFSGPEADVVLLFDNSLIGLVVDRYGENCRISRHDENSFELRVKAKISPQFFAFLFGCGAGVKVLAPESLKKEYAEKIKQVAELY